MVQASSVTSLGQVLVAGQEVMREAFRELGLDPVDMPLDEVARLEALKGQGFTMEAYRKQLKQQILEGDPGLSI